MFVLWAFALLAYSNSFGTGLLLDNRQAILEDARVQAWNATNLEQVFTHDYWNQRTISTLYRPVTTLSFLFNYTVLGNGPNPAGYHWVNFALHSANVLLVYLWGLLLFEEFAPAFALAAVWAVHPVLTESVTNVVGRADLLATLGVLAGLLCHVHAASATGRRKALYLAALALSVAVGAFSKENAAVVVAAMVLYDVAYREKASWGARLSGYIAAIVPVAVFAAVRAKVLAAMPESIPPFYDNPLTGPDFWASRLTAFKVLAKGFGLILWPRHLSIDYSYNQIPLFGWHLETWEDWKAPLSLILCVAAAAIAMACYRRHKPAFFFILFTFAALAPTANIFITIGTIFGERFLYLPAIGAIACAVYFVFHAAGRWKEQFPSARKAAPAFFVLVALVFAARTWARNLDWADELSLWTSAAEASPGSYKTHMDLASTWLGVKAADPDRAIQEVERSVAILNSLPDEWNVTPPYAVAGTWYRMRGDMAPAGERERWYRRGLEILLRGKRVDEVTSREIFRRNQEHGKTIYAGWQALYLELGRTYLRLGETQNGIEALQYSRVLRQDPQAIAEVAHAYRGAGNGEQAAITLMEGVILEPAQRGFAAELVDVYREIDPGGCSVASAAGQVSVNPTCARVHQHICIASRNVAQTYRKTNQTARASEIENNAMGALGCPAALFR